MSEPSSKGQATGPAPGGAPPLSGVRILDFTHVLAGPFCTEELVTALDPLGVVKK